MFFSHNKSTKNGDSFWLGKSQPHLRCKTLSVNFSQRGPAKHYPEHAAPNRVRRPGVSYVTSQGHRDCIAQQVLTKRSQKDAHDTLRSRLSTWTFSRCMLHTKCTVTVQKEEVLLCWCAPTDRTIAREHAATTSTRAVALLVPMQGDGNKTIKTTATTPGQERCWRA